MVLGLTLAVYSRTGNETVVPEKVSNVSFLLNTSLSLQPRYLNGLQAQETHAPSRMPQLYTTDPQLPTFPNVAEKPASHCCNSLVTLMDGGPATTSYDRFVFVMRREAIAFALMYGRRE